jgi:hypothetical protein
LEKSLLDREVHDPYLLILKVHPEMLRIDQHWVAVGEKSGRNYLRPG